MSSRSRRVASILSALGLSAVTLATFVLQGSVGAGAVVRDLHRGVATNSVPIVQSTLDQPLSNPRARYCVGVVSDLLNKRARVNYSSPQVFSGMTIVATNYVFPNGMQGTVVWVVHRVQNGWKIDVERTFAAWTMQSNSPNSRSARN